MIVLWIGIAAVTLARGVEYYATPLQERPFTPGHESLKPSGTIGLGYGVIGTALILFGVMTYSTRKRARIIARAGKLKHWLAFHNFLCTMGPYLILLHTSFRFGGLISIAFWSMVAVVGSGVFGRYVYVRIPKAINGRFLSLREVEGQRDKVLEVGIKANFETSVPGLYIIGELGGMGLIRNAFEQGRHVSTASERRQRPPPTCST
jgi:pheromone shutdown protein TraB